MCYTCTQYCFKFFKCKCFRSDYQIIKLESRVTLLTRGEKKWIRRWMESKCVWCGDRSKRQNHFCAVMQRFNELNIRTMFHGNPINGAILAIRTCLDLSLTASKSIGVVQISRCRNVLNAICKCKNHKTNNAAEASVPFWLDQCKLCWAAKFAFVASIRYAHVKNARSHLNARSVCGIHAIDPARPQLLIRMQRDLQR